VNKVPAGGGAVLALASGLDTPMNIAVDKTAVYWTQWNLSSGRGAVMEVPLTGSVPTTLASPQIDPLHLAVNSTSVFWTDNAGNGPLMTMPLGGGTPTQVPGVFPTGAFAVDDANVYLQGAAPFATGTLARTSIGGGAPSVLASWEGGPPGGIVVDAQRVYWTATAIVPPVDLDASVPPCPLDATCPAGMLPMVPSPNASTVNSVPSGGGPTTTLASETGTGGAGGLALDATSVYYTLAQAPSDLMKVPIAGGAPTKLASNVPGIIAVGDTSVYWATGTSVMKLTPK
jgi:hypothetical protein